MGLDQQDDRGAVTVSPNGTDNGEINLAEQFGQGEEELDATAINVDDADE